MADPDCPPGQLCATGQCAPGCSMGHNDCGDAGLCDVGGGVCRACLTDGDCKDPLLPRCDPAVYRYVACQPMKDNCPLGKYCNKEGDGWACSQGCARDDDCKVVDGGAPTSGCCNHACVDTASDSKNCLTCGNACAMGKTCCASACLGNLGNGCETDTSKSPDPCGLCGKVCVNVPNASRGCTNGACGIGVCNANFKDCNNNGVDGCEVNTGSDVNNYNNFCAKCVVANGGAGCANGACVITGCTAGFADCNASAADGCEVNLTTHAANCGACAKACSANHMASITCGASVCNGACAATFVDCNANKQTDGCEVGIAAQQNCGHSLCIAGVKLVSGCDPAAACVAAICVVDPYCCTTSWDSMCTARVASTCQRKCTC